MEISNYTLEILARNEAERDARLQGWSITSAATAITSDSPQSISIQFRAERYPQGFNPMSTDDPGLEHCDVTVNFSHDGVLILVSAAYPHQEEA